MKWAIRVHDMLTLIKVLVLVLISITGVVALGHGIATVPDPNQNWRNLFNNTKSDPNAYADALFKIFWAYDGWSNLNLSIAELKNPTRNLPIAAGAGVSIVTTLFLMANVAYLTVVPQATAFASKEILAGSFFQIVFGDIAGKHVLPILIGLSAYGAVSAMVFSASRVVFIAAKEKYLPFSSILGEVSSRFGTPVNALIFNWLFTMLLMLAPPPGDAFSFLVDLVGYPSWIFYGLSVVGLLWMRKTMPDKKRPFKVSIFAALFFICVAIFLSIFPFFPPSNPTSALPYYLSALLGLVITVLPVPMWWVMVGNGGDCGRSIRRLLHKETLEDIGERQRDYARWHKKLDDEETDALAVSEGREPTSHLYKARVPEWLDKEVYVAV